ncbi:MAG: SH3 domain-containing protein [Oscillospiraceae bacterium]|nr:SH3 domain-containing protein [Oscillospiraceae bacterium]
MKKRIVCVLLTLIMLMSLVPMTASAASNKVSEAAITVLKQLETFNSSCTKMPGVTATSPVFVTGYGTACTKEHALCDKDGLYHHVNKKNEWIMTGSKYSVTTQAEADKALREALKTLDEKVNAFATANSLSLSQNQHDALVIFSYDAGAGWTTGNGVVKTAVINKYGTNELLNALSNWAGEGKVTDRRKIEVNMYVNGVYSNTAPTTYTTVTYNANGGVLPQANGESYTMNFDQSATVAHSVIPAKVGYKFLGWYNAKATPSVRYDSLSKDCAGKTLYAQWQSNTVTAKNAATTAMSVNYTLKTSELLEKRWYYTPETTATSWDVSYQTVNICREFQDANGIRWGQVVEAGKGTGMNRWVRLSGAKVAETSDGTQAAFQVYVTVTNSFVNRRVNASSASAKNGSYSQGKELLIINEDDGWGQVGQILDDGSIKAIGWVCLMYTNWDEVRGGAVETPNTSTIATATVTYNGYLNIRAEAGTDSKIVGALAKNDTVEVYEIKTFNGHQWGRISNGWICLSYTVIDNFSGTGITTDAGANSYMFTAKLKTATNFYADASVNAALRYHSKDVEIPDGTVKILQLKADNEGNTWVKALWYVDHDKDAEGIKEMPLYGWAKLSKFTLDPARYTTAVDNVTVREQPSSGAPAKDVKLAKGVEVTITEVVLVGENIWGKTEAHGGWVNLASKYFSRTDVVVNESNTSNISTNLMATVINTDSLKVRKTGATYGAIIGSLSRGTTVNVWEANADKSWYKVDSNKNGTYDYNGDGWVSANYVSVSENVTNSTVTDKNGNSYQTDGTGTGIVANTYSGVNVRQGAGTGYALVGKLLPGTVVEILETKQAGAGKWGRVAQGWISMDYVAMMTYNEVVDNSSNIPEGGIGVDSYDDAQKTTTTAVYTGAILPGAKVRVEANKNADVIREVTQIENITIYELATVKQTVKEDAGTSIDPAGNKDQQVITTTEITYWARINDGWVKDPEQYIDLAPLDEKVHTMTGSTTLNVRETAGSEGKPESDKKFKLAKGDKVTVTSLEIVDSSVWGYIECDKGEGWASLSYMSEGAIYENKPVETPPVNNTPSAPVIGNGSSTGGFVTNTSGYRYTGKVIRTNELNVRSTPSTTASKTTTLTSGQALVIYETTTAENMAWGRCDAGWVYLYYVDMTPVTGAVDARVVYNDNTIIYTDMNCTSTAGTYARMSVVDIYEIVGKMARTELGWVNTDNLL